jgi:hypothetical protein
MIFPPFPALLCAGSQTVLCLRYFCPWAAKYSRGSSASDRRRTLHRVELPAMLSVAPGLDAQPFRDLRRCAELRIVCESRTPRRSAVHEALSHSRAIRHPIPARVDVEEILETARNCSP